jgi:drug/metabolite transporter (DMT)-like permease
MAGSSLIVPIVDGIAKLLSESFSPLFIAWARYAIATVIVMSIAFVRFKFKWNLFPRANLVAHFLRTLCLVVAMTLFFMALQWTSLATAITAYFSSPVIAMVLSVLILKERVSATKIVSLCLGMIGALVVLRPFAGGERGAALALLAGVFHAIYLIATKLAVKESDPIKTLAFQYVVGTALLTPQAAMTFNAHSSNLAWLFVALGVLSALAHFLTILAFQYAEASMLSPLVYLELIGATFFGLIVFGNVPDPPTIIGAVFIAAAGLILHRTRSAMPEMPQYRSD